MFAVSQRQKCTVINDDTNDCVCVWNDTHTHPYHDPPPSPRAQRADVEYLVGRVHGRAVRRPAARLERGRRKPPRVGPARRRSERGRAGGREADVSCCITR